MSSPSMSSLKPWPCSPPPLEKSTSKSNFTLLSVVCSLSIARLRPLDILRYSPNLGEGPFPEVRITPVQRTLGCIATHAHLPIILGGLALAHTNPWGERTGDMRFVGELRLMMAFS